MRDRVDRRGLAFIIVLAFILVLAIAAVAFIVLSGTEIRMARRQRDSTKAFYLAEAGVEKALLELYRDEDYVGETNVSLGEGVYDVAVTSLDDQKQIDAIGYVPDIVSPRAQRKVRAIAEKPSDPVKVLGALTAGGNIQVSGTAEIDGQDAAGITVPSEDMVDIAGDAEVEGDPTILTSEFEEFEATFGMTEEELKALATVYTNPPPNQPDPAEKITWIEGDAKFTKQGWEGSGILVVTEDLTMTGGEFDGIIYVMGALKLAGNTDVEGAVLVAGAEHSTGTSSIEYDEETIRRLGELYPYEIVLWQEVE